MTTMLTQPSTLMVKAFVEASVRLGGVVIPYVSPDDRTLAGFFLTVEGAVASGLASFDSIARLDTAWHTAVYSGRMDFDPHIQSEIEECYRTWRGGTGAFLAIIDALETRGRSIPGADTLRANFREVEGMLTPDDRFFESAELDRLADEATSAHDRGETVEFSEMGD